jgi:RNA polymerase-binding protein DksA
MNTEKEAEFADLLRKRRGDLVREVRAKMQEARGQNADMLETATMDDADKATVSERESLDYAEAARDNRELAEVDAALERLARGEYGICVDCEQPIPVARLRAYPAATRCSQCQQDFELRQKTGTTQAYPAGRSEE